MKRLPPLKLCLCRYRCYHASLHALNILINAMIMSMFLTKLPLENVLDLNSQSHFILLYKHAKKTWEGERRVRKIMVPHATPQYPENGVVGREGLSRQPVLLVVLKVFLGEAQTFNPEPPLLGAWTNNPAY